MSESDSQTITKQLMAQTKARGLKRGFVISLVLCVLIITIYLIGGDNLQQYLLFKLNIDVTGFYLLLFVVLTGISGLCMYIPMFKTLRAIEHAMQGHCMHCGYDLRGVDQMCPECGKAQQELYRRFNDWDDTIKRS